MKLRSLPLFIFILLQVTAFAQPLDTEMIRRIKEEGTTRSGLDWIARQLTDVNGPRLTNSPGYRRALQWVESTTRSWGLSNPHAEPWGVFGPGWSLERCYVAMRAPYYHTLIAVPLAWSMGTPGEIKASVVVLDGDDSTAVPKAATSIKGKVVLMSDMDTSVRMPFKPAARRLTDSALVNTGDTFMESPEDMKSFVRYISNRQKQLAQLKAAGAAAVIFNGHYEDGTMEAEGYDYKKGQQSPVPQLSVSKEDFLRIRRLVNGGVNVELELDVRTRLVTSDLTASNVIAEIPGTDPSLKSEVVMLGGHLDSWHGGTGATDNAAGSIAALEAIRILKTLGVKPRRTIRLILWGGEEQGLLGSYYYTKKHFGDPATMKLLPEQAKVSAYYNIDNGTGKVRGIYLQNNDAAATVFKEWFAAIGDSTAQTAAHANTGSTDHFALDAVGIPAFQFIQDPLEYLNRTHHTNMDVYDHLSIPDLQQAATMMAIFVYNTAQRDQQIPRKPLPPAGVWIFEGF